MTEIRTSVQGSPVDLWAIDKGKDSVQLTLDDVLHLVRLLITNQHLLVFDPKTKSLEHELEAAINGRTIQIALPDR